MESRRTRATSSAKNPFVKIRTDVDGCISGHEDHADDFVSFDGESCVEGCYPEGAPVGAGDKCCDPLQAVEGVCKVTWTNECLEKAITAANEAYSNYCPPGNERCDTSAAAKHALATFQSIYTQDCKEHCIKFSCITDDDKLCIEECLNASWGQAE